MLLRVLMPLTHRCSFNADEDTEQRCGGGGYRHHPGVC